MIDSTSFVGFAVVHYPNMYLQTCCSGGLLTLHFNDACERLGTNHKRSACQPSGRYNVVFYEQEMIQDNELKTKALSDEWKPRHF